jgi:DNA-directed RNA polymerase specialized sigma24 family protein
MDSSSNIEELELVRRATHGDHEAFHRLVLCYEPQLLAYLMQVLGNWEDAYDIAQETFIAAYYALPRWRPIEQARTPVKEQASEQQVSLEPGERAVRPLAPWLYRIATNRALTLLKKQSLQRSCSQYKQEGLSQIKDVFSI